MAVSNGTSWSKDKARHYSELKAIFIPAPREISKRRLIQIAQHYLPKGNLVLGLAKEPYILGFEGQPQFRALQLSAVMRLVDQINAASKKYKIETLEYAQKDLPAILRAIDFSRLLLINGSWQYVFHRSSANKVLQSKKIPYKHISPFCDEAEAKQYYKSVAAEIHQPKPKPNVTEPEMLQLALEYSKLSFDYCFQTGVVLARKSQRGYDFLLGACNRVIPYQTYAMHHGASREINRSDLHDTNHYDTIHAEMDILVEAQKQKLDLKNTTLFVNLLPCPNCARTLSQTDIAEFVYTNDHSSEYAVKLFEAVGKKVRKV